MKTIPLILLFALGASAESFPLSREGWDPTPNPAHQADKNEIIAVFNQHHSTYLVGLRDGKNPNDLTDVSGCPLRATVNDPSDLPPDLPRVDLPGKDGGVNLPVIVNCNGDRVGINRINVEGTMRVVLDNSYFQQAFAGSNAALYIHKTEIDGPRATTRSQDGLECAEGLCISMKSNVKGGENAATMSTGFTCYKSHFHASECANTSCHFDGMQMTGSGTGMRSLNCNHEFLFRVPVNSIRHVTIDGPAGDARVYKSLVGGGNQPTVIISPKDDSTSTWIVGTPMIIANTVGFSLPGNSSWDESSPFTNLDMCTLEDDTNAGVFEFVGGNSLVDGSTPAGVNCGVTQQVTPEQIAEMEADMARLESWSQAIDLAVDGGDPEPPPPLGTPTAPVLVR